MDPIAVDATCLIRLSPQRGRITIEVSCNTKGRPLLNYPFDACCPQPLTIIHTPTTVATNFLQRFRMYDEFSAISFTTISRV